MFAIFSVALTDLNREYDNVLSICFQVFEEKQPNQNDNILDNEVQEDINNNDANNNDANNNSENKNKNKNNNLNKNCATSPPSSCNDVNNKIMEHHHHQVIQHQNKHHNHNHNRHKIWKKKSMKGNI